MKLDRLLLLLVLFILLSLYARIEAVRLASGRFGYRVRLRHYLAGLAFALGQTLLFVALVPWAVWRWYVQHRRRR